FNGNDDGVDAETKRRLNHGISLYRKGLTQNIIVSGGNRGFRELKGSRYMARYAARQGVAEESIFIEDRSWDSLSNLEGIFSIMLKNGWRSLHLVSSPCHLARIGYIADPELITQITWAPYPSGSANPPAGTVERLISANYNLAAYLFERLLPRTLYRPAVGWLRNR
ncbi:MAG: YdcF family protein, partial [Pseudomonadota bacterium]